MEVTLEVPETVAKALGYARETLPRRALEALLVDECARGRLSRGKSADSLSALGVQKGIARGSRRRVR